MLKVIDIRIIQVIRLQNLVDQIRLRHDFWNVGHACNRIDFLNQIIASSCVFLASEICQFQSIHQRIEPYCTGLILIRKDQRSQFFTDHQSILVGQAIIISLIGILIDILDMLPYRKVLTIQFVYLASHISNQQLPIGNQTLGLICDVLQLVGNFELQSEDSAL